MAKPTSARTAGLLSVSLGLLGADSILLVVAWLRETPEFWRNSGGASTQVREMVRMLFYPSLFGVATAQVMLWAVLLRFRSKSMVLYLLSALATLGLVLVLLLTVANNLLNLWEGRPFHWHPEAP